MPGDKTIIVESVLDWVAGDKIYIAPNTHNHKGSDYATIVSNKNGVLVLDKPV